MLNLSSLKIRWSRLTFNECGRDANTKPHIAKMLIDPSFTKHFDINVNFCKYLAWYRRGKYDPDKVRQSLARIVAAYQRKTGNHNTSLDDIKQIAYDWEQIVRQSIIKAANAGRK